MMLPRPKTRWIQETMHCRILCLCGCLGPCNLEFLCRFLLQSLVSKLHQLTKEDGFESMTGPLRGDRPGRGADSLDLCDRGGGSGRDHWPGRASLALSLGSVIRCEENVQGWIQTTDTSSQVTYMMDYCFWVPIYCL